MIKGKRMKKQVAGTSEKALKNRTMKMMRMLSKDRPKKSLIKNKLLKRRERAKMLIRLPQVHLPINKSQREHQSRENNKNKFNNPLKKNLQG